tara:strand:+ start:812 stop:964 length:153 start_codon:yes stop_codon:yes gene_type:complete
MKMISPDGKISIDCHPSNVDNYLGLGWKEEATHSLKKEKHKSSSKKKSEE